ncbi:MAG: hypothetical protein FJW31_26345 [Acidobacteria bacterium]|nr:hypothetical protein [Acidobacteriota bacterium]
MNDPASTEVYLSSRTGEVILETTRSSRLLAWAGAIPHWIYLRAIRVFAEEWRLGVITISFIGAFMSVLGIVVGTWRYSPSRKNRNRELGPQPTPYSGAKKLHHYTGLAFGLLTFTFTYIREGTMSFAHLDGWWTDAGTFESLLRAGNLVAETVQRQSGAQSA